MSKVEEKREAFVERVTASLEAGIVPWCNSELPTAPQQKASSGKAYSGLNALFLLEAASSKGYTDPRWLTSKEVQDYGLKIRAGEKSASLEFWNKDDDGKTSARNYPVFNMQQLYGMDKAGLEKYTEPDYEKAGEFLKKAGMEIPPAGEKESYQEAVKSLLISAAEKNDALNGIQSPSLKELRTNIAGAFLMLEAGLPPLSEKAPTEDWAKTLRLNPKELFRAVRDAVKLTQEVLGLVSERSQSGREIEVAEPAMGQRVTFHPNEGKNTLTGTVIELNKEAVTLQCGRMTVSAFRDKGTFSAVPELDVTATKEHAKEQAHKHLGEKGNVFFALGENASYKGEIVELTSNFALQKVNENVVLHRLKDLTPNENQSLIREGQNLDISKDIKGEVTIKAWGKEREEQGNRQSREGQTR